MAKPIFEPDFALYRKPGFYETMELQDNDKSKEKFIKDIERYIRTSLEYRNYIKYLKSEAKLNYCMVMHKLPEDLANSLSIEMHHFPLTLYDIVETILDKYLKNNTSFTRLTIANEVMENHYLGRVGIVPLTISMHQLAHSGANFIAREDVYGKPELFCKEYETFLTDSGTRKVALMNTVTSAGKQATLENFLEIDPRLFEEIDSQDYTRLEFLDSNIEVHEEND